jgi:hypothetical protein
MFFTVLSHMAVGLIDHLVDTGAKAAARYLEVHDLPLSYHIGAAGSLSSLTRHL